MNNLIETVQHITSYFEEHLPQYTVFEIQRKSFNPDDDYLYMVAAKKQNAAYAVWSWNESIRSLNHGHYDLPSMEACAKIMTEYQTSHSTYSNDSKSPLEVLHNLLIKNDDKFEDPYQEIIYITGFVNGIAAQHDNKWKKMTEKETDSLFREAVDDLAV